MPGESPKSSKRLLDPMERISEVLFGLIMALCITGSISVAEAGREEVRTMLLGALGCNLAWGIIDGVFYLMTCLSERGRGLIMLRELRKAADPREAHGIIAGALPPLLASVLSPAESESMRERLNQLPELSGGLRLTKDDWLRAAGVFLLVVSSTFPVVIPFMFHGDARLALHISNGIAIVMLFLTGYAFGCYAGRHPWWTGFWMVVLGAVLVGVTKALGG
jgi:VIT family